MPAIKRRHFLQSAGATLAAIGLSQVDFLQQASQFDRVNAQSAPRKFALLVGINAYPNGNSLSGCLTDVRSMQILLEHRYGFDPSNIKVLTDAQATRQGILSAFETHLIAQANPGDVVVFHFSGHGHMVLDPDPNPGFTYNNKGVNGTLIPYDVDKGEPNNIRSIMGHTLFLLMSALKTENVTVILDSCHSGGGLRGNTKIRAFNLRDSQNNQIYIPDAPQEELAYQKTLLNTIGMSEPEFKQKRKLGIAKGIGIGAAKLDQEAQDTAFNGFNAGAFTYLLTRYLWQLPIAQPLDSMFTNLELSTQMLVDKTGTQVPNYEAKPKSGNQQQPIFFATAPRPAAEAVIYESPQPGQPIAFWLAGVSPSALESYETGAVFNLIDAQGQTIGEVEQTVPRKGLEAAGKLRSGSIQPTKGMLLREQIRSVPTNIKLKVGLDPSLGETLPTIQSSLSTMSWLAVMPTNQQPSVDYIIGRMTTENTKRLQARSLALPPVDAISLFTADLTPIPEAF
ncbi:MAG: caspase family protein, partial [Kovacikia sp.]